MDITTTAFWAAVASIVLANVVLSGDNAVVIAMAARGLPARQQTRAILWGSVAAVVLRVALTLVAVEMLRQPWLKIVGGLLLLYLGASLLRDDDGRAKAPAQAGSMGVAIRTILLADLVMSVDNVLAVAAAAHGNLLLLVIGLVLSVPLIVFGSTLLLEVMQRLPFIVTLCAALLGYLAGEMLLTDPWVSRRYGEASRAMVHWVGAGGAAMVVVLGLLLRRFAHRTEAAHD